MRKIQRFVLISTLSLGVLGCAADTTVKADSDGRAQTTAHTAAAASRAIPAGTVLKVSLIDSLDTDTSVVGDRFLATLTEPVTVDGTTVLAGGTMVRGRVASVKESGKVKGLASIGLVLTDIMQGDKATAITTERFVATAGTSQKRDAEIIGGGAGIGAVIGAVAGGKKGAAIGAITGGGAGTGGVLLTKGKDIHYGPETHLNFTLVDSIQM